MDKTCAIIVSHNPNFLEFEELTNAIKSQVKRVYIIDNGSEKSFRIKLNTINYATTVLLRNNVGIAAALNIGILMAKSDGYSNAILLDHDSIPPNRMVESLLHVAETLKQSGINVSGIGPRHRDIRTGILSRFVSYRWFHFSHRSNRKKSNILPADFLISSGSFYDLTVFDHVGYFNEGLFIDHVDTEWFLRAKVLGFNAFGVQNVVMDHSLGVDSLSICFLKNRVQPIHKRWRLYFVTRNSVLLYRMKHIPLKWITGDVVRLIRLFLVYLIFISNRNASFGYIFKGLLDGVRGNAGPFPR